MTMYARQRPDLYKEGLSIPCTSTPYEGQSGHMQVRDWTPSWQPDALDDEAFNVIIVVGKIVYRLISIDLEFKEDA